MPDSLHDNPVTYVEKYREDCPENTPEPYAVGYVDLDEGFRMMSNIVAVADPTTDIKIAQRVKLQWEDQGDGEVSLPMFAPA